MLLVEFGGESYSRPARKCNFKASGGSKVAVDKGVCKWGVGLG